MYDVCIVGAGVIGCSIARELSKYNLNICILEKSDDVSNGASKANSGIVHGGYAVKHGTLKAELIFKGNRLYKKLNEELNFGYRKTGGMVLGFSEEDLEILKSLYKNGIENGVNPSEIRMLSSKEIIDIEPNINKDVKYALYSSDIGVASPYELNIALAENSIKNGVKLFLNNEVISISKATEGFILVTKEQTFESKYIVNAAGVFNDTIANLVGIYNFSIVPMKGQYLLLQKKQGHLANTVLFQVPTKLGKGILVTQTYHGNLKIGPNAEEVDVKDNLETTENTLNYIIDTARKSVPGADINKILTSFSGIRATTKFGDFIIEESEIKSFINVAAIDSPGLTSSPAIAIMIKNILEKSGLVLYLNDNFDPYRAPIIIKKIEHFKGVVDSKEPKNNIICRCEKVTEAEIIDSLHRGIDIKSIDGIKRRTRAGMGICQGNFCRHRVKSLIAKELNIKEEDVIENSKSGQLKTIRLYKKHK